MSPTSYQAALPRVIPSLLSATLIIIPYSNGFVKRVRKVFLQRKQRAKTRLPTFFPENQQPRQFTPLREGRQTGAPEWMRTYQFQFTPLRERRYCNRRCPISIHAPPRGATWSTSTTTTLTKTFQFTPLREGRRRSTPCAAAWAYFNSRPSARGDWNETHVGKTHPKFQFTPLREGRLTCPSQIPSSLIFQFTPLREGRRGLLALPSLSSYFNSRPSARGDQAKQCACTSVSISIHAPPRGATTSTLTKPDLQRYFNSRPSARGDF